MTRRSTVDPSFDSLFAEQALRSERLRISILVGVFAALLVYLVGAEVLGGRTFPGEVLIPSTLLVLVYELGMWGLVDRKIHARARVPSLVWYANATIEASFASIVLLLVLPRFEEPVFSLLSPAQLVYVPFIVLAALQLDGRLPLYAGAVAGLQYGAIALYVLSAQTGGTLPEALLAPHFYVSRVPLLLATGASAAFLAREVRGRVFETFRVVEERDRITRIFGQHTSPEVVDVLLARGGEPGSERRNVCVMFLDIRDFTSFSETRDPADVVTYVNRLFEFMVDVVHSHDGFIQQYTGDGFMAVFGAPIPSSNPARDGIQGALSIVERLDRAVAEGRVPETRVGIGLHSGVAMVGTVGSELHREFKVMGDTVNTAARVEELCKETGARILATAAAWEAADLTIEANDLGEFPIRGRERGLRIRALA